MQEKKEIEMTDEDRIGRKKQRNTKKFATIVILQVSIEVVLTAYVI